MDLPGSFVGCRYFRFVLSKPRVPPVINMISSSLTFFWAVHGSRTKVFWQVCQNSEIFRVTHQKRCQNPYIIMLEIIQMNKFQCSAMCSNLSNSPDQDIGYIINVKGHDFFFLVFTVKFP